MQLKKFTLHNKTIPPKKLVAEPSNLTNIAFKLIFKLLNSFKNISVNFINQRPHGLGVADFRSRGCRFEWHQGQDSFTSFTVHHAA